MMRFHDLATGQEGAERGLAFANDDRSWMVAVSDKGPHPEWIVWQRAVPGDSRPSQQGYVRRVAWLRFGRREQAEFMAGVLDDLPVTGSGAVLRHAVRTAVREWHTRLVFAALRRVSEALEEARRAEERRHASRRGSRDV